ncbi:MAG: radical SAM protein [Candidatus Thorarchaeota archaeon]
MSFKVLPMIDGVLIVDALASGDGRRSSSRDVIGVGPRAVAGVMERHDIPCRIARAEDIISTPNRIRSFSHLALSAMSMDLPTVRRVVDLWKRLRRTGRILVGGPISSAPSLVLNEVRPDVVVIGEGEITLSELVSSGFFEDSSPDLSSIDGLGYIDGGQVRITPPRELIPEESISNLRPSVHRIVDYPSYQASRVYVEVVRGCSNFMRPRLRLQDGRQCVECGGCESEDLKERIRCPEGIPPGCGFCSVPAVWGPPRSRSVESVVEEVRLLLEAGVHRVVLAAPDFLDFHRGPQPLTDPCHPPANLREIRRLLEALVRLPSVMNGLCHIGIENIKACLLTEDVVRVISGILGDTSIHIGLETGSGPHMRAIGKYGSPEDVLHAVSVAKKHGLRPFVYLIYGLPGESPETTRMTLDMMHRLYQAGMERVVLYGFRPLPGSAFQGSSPPSPRDQSSRVLQEVARRLNKARKTEQIGKVVRGIAAEMSSSRHGYTMVYPLGDGPIMTVPGGFSAGRIVSVRVTRVLTPELVEGIVIEES